MGLRIRRKHWGRINNREVELICIRMEPTGSEVALTNYGARIVSVKVPDRNGMAEEITLGHDRLEEYLSEKSYFGCTTGRVANRIANAEFDLDGVTHHLAKNDLGRHHLHGGLEGFDAKVWEVAELEEGSDAADISFDYTSPDGEEGYPGTVQTRVKFSISERQIEISYRAITDKPTIINLTNHTYWNLSGTSTTVHDHQVSIPARNSLEIDDEIIPTGRLLPVKGTPIDFLGRKVLRGSLETLGGIDNSFVLDKGMSFGVAARVFDMSTGRKMTVETDQPAIVFYTGNHLEGRKAWGKPCTRHQALCIEAQQYPDAIHHPNFPSIVLRPQEIYSQVTCYNLTVMPH